MKIVSGPALSVGGQRLPKGYKVKDQTAEVTAAIAQIIDEDNFIPLLTIHTATFSWEVSVISPNPTPSKVAWENLQSAVQVLRAKDRRRHRQLLELMQDALLQVQQCKAPATHPRVSYSVRAIVAKELIGALFTQEDYQTLIYPLTEFLEIITSTPKDSPERTLLCDMVVNGATVSQGLATSRSALLL